MDILNFSFTQINKFILIFVRTAAILFAIPIFRSLVIPFRVRISFIVALTFSLTSIVNVPVLSLQNYSLYALIPMVLAETFLGLLIGLTIQCIFAAIETGSEVISIQMGLGMARLFDPVLGDQVTSSGQLYSLIAMVLFFSLNIHHVLIKALIDSFYIIPFDQIKIDPSFLRIVTHITNNIFVLAIKIAIPLIAFLLLTNLSMAVVGRMVPQMNIMAVGTPLLSILGFLILGFSLPFFVLLIKKAFMGIEGDVFRIITHLSGRG